ncbi:hypothetical protein L596_017700 [Steinernema carpocapsae]|uniref:Uncharacterized protein n=1 Tax=Steinernema carpocapsae TaxID=34508 RepID=A0A4U5N383_STECR|nr:hypothetical protein L596_017700 [Steinernema carpocapsae]
MDQSTLINPHNPHFTMDQLPAEFYENVLSNVSATLPKLFNPIYTRLMGGFGNAARALDKKRHTTSLKVIDGKLSQVAYYDRMILRGPQEDRAIKFRQRKYVLYKRFTEHWSLISAKLKNQLKRYAMEPGMLSLCLKSNVLENEWIQLFTSWKSLQFFSICVPFSRPLRELLENFMSQKQLLHLSNHSSNYGIPGLFLFCQFLKQDQFLVLRLDALDELLKQQILHIWSQNKHLLAGKMVRWTCEGAPMPSGCFECPERIDHGVMRLENQDFVAEHYNLRGTVGMSYQEFMKDVHCTEWRFK